MFVLVILLCRDAIVAVVLRFFADSLTIIFTGFTIVGTKTGGFLPLQLGGSASYTTLLQLALILVSYPSNLRDIYTLLHQFGNNLGI